MAENEDVKISPLSRVAAFLGAKGEAPPHALEPPAVLAQRQAVNSALSIRYIVILALACMIAALGLLADSAVVVIGAMLIAPLMKPIMALSFGIVTGKFRLFSRSFITVAAGIVITVGVAAGTELLFELRGPTEEVLSRTEPSLLDLGVAIAAALAATFATTRPNIADSLPGVAIAVALVPPLCVTGIGVSTMQWDVATGSFLLFFVNLAAIIFCASIIFLIDGYGKIKLSLPGLLVVALVLAALAPSLFATMNRLQVDDAAQTKVVEFLRDHYNKNRVAHPDDLRRVDVILGEDHVFVFVELEAPADVFTQADLEYLHREIAKDLDKPLNLKIQFDLTHELTLYDHLLGDGTKPTYGNEDAIPRR